MTNTEIGTEMDIIYENINKGGAPGLTNYEKSVILSHAQELYIRESLKQDPSGNIFPQLITIYVDAAPDTSSSKYTTGVVFTLPLGILSISNETVADSTSTYVVIRLSNEDLDIKQSSPYKYPPRRRAWGVQALNGSIPSIEIIGRPGSTLVSYKARYIKKPVPIVIGSISPSIDGISTDTTCALDAGLHREILKVAVALAENYYYDKYGNNGTDGDKR